MEPYTHEMIRLLMRNCGYARLYWLFRTNGFRKLLDNSQAKSHFVRTVECCKPEWDSLVKMVTNMTLGSQEMDCFRDMPLWNRINDQWNRISLPRLAKAMIQDSKRPILFLNDDLTSAIMGACAPIHVDNTSPRLFLNDDLNSAAMEYAAQLQEYGIQLSLNDDFTSAIMGLTAPDAGIQNTDGITVRIDDRERQ